MSKTARRWSTLALAVGTSGMLLMPAFATPTEPPTPLPPPAKTASAEPATDLLPGALRARAEAYLKPSKLSEPSNLLLGEVTKISTENSEQAAAKKRAEDEKAAAEKAAAEKAAAEKAAAEKAAKEKEAAEKAAAEKAAAEQAAQQEAARKASGSSKSQSSSSSNATSTSKSSNTSSNDGGTSKPPSGAGIECGPRSGDGNLQEWPARVRTRIAKQFGVKDIGGYRATASGEHGKGLALDVMTYSDSAKGKQILQWVIDHHKELNVYYVIYQQKIYGDWTGWGPKAMEDRGSITANHFDHVHISFNPGMGTCPSN